MAFLALFLALFGLLGWLYLAFAQGQFWVPVMFEPVWRAENGNWPSVDIIIPARDEAAILPRSLPSLLAQDYPGRWRIVLVDDHSGDGTAVVAQGLESDAAKLSVVSAPDLPAGWRGKVAAMQAGVAESTADYILFTDADIRHPPDSLRRLVARAEARGLDLVSQMVRLNCTTLAEKLLIPAFVFFFAMLYPFRKANDPSSRVAAAAGGTMLLHRSALDRAGGLECMRGALIDDCALARIIKRSGGKIELSLVDDVHSLRVYAGFRDIWRMVARTAFTQLSHSLPVLGGCVFGMAALFLAPVFVLIFGNGAAAAIGGAAYLAMTLLYVPMILFYRLPALCALTLPLAALIYIAATIDSARLYWQGRGGQWKGRVQA